MIPTLHLIHGWRHRQPVAEPLSHLDGPFILRPRPYDWFVEDPELADATPPHGIERAWLRTELGLTYCEHCERAVDVHIELHRGVRFTYCDRCEATLDETELD